MKKYACMLIVFLLMFLIPVTVAANEMTVVVDGENVEFEHPLLLEGGRMLIPMRELFIALGAVVMWDDTSRTVLAVVDDVQISVPIGSELPTVDDVPILIEVPAMFVNNRTYIPLRFAAESLGGNVSWEPDSDTAIITTDARVDTAAEDRDRYIQVLYTEEGVGSWYGARFHGNRTASGEVFDMHLHTAAHRTLPFGTIVKVTYQETGRSVWVRINDRGPCGVRHPERIIDLSRAAADAIGLRWIGPVEVEVIKEEN